MSIRRPLFTLVLILVPIVLVEIFFVAVYFINPFSIFPWQSYSKAFQDISIPKNTNGWTGYDDKPRPNHPVFPRKCISVFGDSFSHADEVDDHEAWTNLLAQSMRCQVDNFGVPGYGLDQAYLRYKEASPSSEIVILGLYQEMLRRNFAASWTFYNAQKNVSLKPYFVINNGALKKVPYPEISTINSLKKYHQDDRYYNVFNIGFPYTLSTLKSSCYRFEAESWSEPNKFAKKSKDLIRKLCANFNGHSLSEQIITQPFANQDSVELALLFIDAMHKKVVGNKQKFVIVLFPSPNELGGISFSYEKFITRIKYINPNTCIIDPGPALHKASMLSGHSLKAPKGHYDRAGNRVIADEVKRSISMCEHLH